VSIDNLPPDHVAIARMVADDICETSAPLPILVAVARFVIERMADAAFTRLGIADLLAHTLKEHFRKGC
jgi:hypothetical protein